MARPLNITDEAILEALTTHPEVTSAELAEILGIGQSTAGKRLAALEAGGSARRAPGGRVDGRRLADRWAAAASPATVEAEPPILADTGSAADDASAGHPAPSDREPSDTEPATAADRNEPAADAPVGDVATVETGPRLGRGELGSLVRDYLAAHPGESFGPSAVGKALGRSQGAISNSLASMAAKGEVELVGDKPRRYRIAVAG